MNDKNRKDSVTRSVPAVRGALIAIVLMLVVAGCKVNAVAQTTVASQTTPEKKVEVGVGGVTDDSFKFGEYNGLQNQGPFGVGSFDLRGGAAYDSGSAWRWRLTGRPITSRCRQIGSRPRCRR